MTNSNIFPPQGRTTKWMRKKEGRRTGPVLVYVWTAFRLDDLATPSGDTELSPRAHARTPARMHARTHTHTKTLTCGSQDLAVPLCIRRHRREAEERFMAHIDVDSCPEIVETTIQSYRQIYSLLSMFLFQGKQFCRWNPEAVE